MSYQPRAPVGRCRACGGAPGLRARFWRYAVRLECNCGVAGQWVVPGSADVQVWNAAARGWEAVSFPFPPPGPPPMPGIQD